MRNGLVFLTLCLLSSWLFAGALAPADALLGGVLRDQTGRACASQKLELWQAEKLVAQTQSDACGIYLFSALPAGNYSLKIESAAFQRGIQIKKARLNIQNLRLSIPAGLKPTEYPWDIAPGSIFIERPVPSAGPYVSPLLPPYRNEDFLPALPNSFVSTWKYSSIPIPFSQSTASYNNLKRLLYLNRLPQPASIHLEEYYNAFDYDFPAPDAGEAFKTTVEIATNPFNPQRDLLFIGIQAENIAEPLRSPVNLVFVINGSGSMATTHKIDFIKNSLRKLSHVLYDYDRISIVRYGTLATIILDSCKGNDTAKILDSLERLKASGEGDLDRALDTAYMMATKNFLKDGANSVIHLSDGLVKSKRSEEDLASYIKGYADRGITLRSVGFGASDFDDSSLRNMAKAGKGWYQYIDSQLSADKAMLSPVGNEISLLAKDLSLMMAISPERYKAFRYLGFANDFASVAEELEYPAIDLHNMDSYGIFIELIPRSSTEKIENLVTSNPALYEGDGRNGFWCRFKKPQASEYTLKWLDFERALEKPRQPSMRFRRAAAALGLGLYLKEDSYSTGLNMLQIKALAEGAWDDNSAAKTEFLRFCTQIEKLKP